MAGEASIPAKRQADMMTALKEAAFAALVTFGLCIPIIAWGTRQNLDNPQGKGG